MNVNRKLLFAFGVSLLVAILTGVLKSETKYFLTQPGDEKSEITEATYNDYFDDQHNWQHDYSKWTSQENVFNIKSSIIYGLTTFGFLIIVISIVGDRTTQPIS